MNFSEEETKTQERSIDYVNRNQELLIDKHVHRKKPLQVGFVTIFMAGSPGSGKTEFSERWIENAYNKNTALKKKFEKFQKNIKNRSEGIIFFFS